MRVASGWGQANTVFYNFLKTRQFKNHILALVDHNGGLIQGRVQIENHLTEFYKELLGNSIAPRLKVDPELVQQGALLTVSQQLEMIQPITEKEVWDAISNISPNKSPGSDGYTSQFFKVAWPKIGSSVVRAIKGFFAGDALPVELNRTIITFLPKTENPQTASEYCPISCCSTLYKVITKILCSRLGKVLPDIISESQGAFFKGRVFSHNVLLAQELLHHYNWKSYHGISSCMLKLDLKKAFDSLEWSFLFSFLQAFKFSPVFIQWIRKCVESSTFLIYLNGGFTKAFAAKRGVKQGGPLSPLLFVIAMEYFSRLLSMYFQEGRVEYHMQCQRVGLNV